MYGFISKKDGMIQNEQIESLLVRYYNGELDEKEVQDIKAWIDASAANRKIASEVYHICFAADNGACHCICCSYVSSRKRKR